MTARRYAELCGVATLLTAVFAAPAAADTGSAQSSGTVTVTTTADAPAANPFDGRCRTRLGECTLRAAVQVADARPGTTIVLPPGHYRLTIPPNPLNINGPLIDPTTGDLDITSDTTILGAGRDETIIDGNHLDRVLLTTADVALSGLTVTGGNASQREIPLYDTGGGGIANSGRLSLDHVTVTGNAADYGGGIFNIPVADMKVTDSLISGNAGGEAGGVRCDNTCTFTRTIISDNRVTNPGRWYRPGGFAGRGGGLDIRGVGLVVLIDSQVVRNSATDGGGGINIAPAYLDTLPYQLTDAVNPGMGHLILRGSTIAANTSGLGERNCKKVFADITSTGGNTSDDASCDLTAAGDRVGP
ncbi:CSLREA domain-containing protein [Nocardia pseudobrasiliensis]|uniref:CSLREA domain-containing protein n=1 Tax=Nocardia pseudobrasiliensis TaxID=45979 RepID=A0A370ID88_9NOCA|nr:CSLREA domain-containing protein [Nocardia pseudobrasiliensis]RDI68697.1 CSLREA domain-containing protein [Nocardia pseudobrasiliensis]